MLTDMWFKRHFKKIPPPKKKKSIFFWGGGIFFWIKLSILTLGETKNSGQTLGLNGLYQPQIGQWSANLDQKTTIEFSKIWLFSIFWEFFELFEFNLRFCSKIEYKSLKMVFWDSLDPKDYFYLIFVQFWKSKILNFFTIFPIPFCRLNQISVNMLSRFSKCVVQGLYIASH